MIADAVRLEPIAFSIGGPTTVQEDPTDGGNLATYTISYNGDLADGEASVTVQTDGDTDDFILDKDVINAIQNAANVTDGVSFNSSTGVLTFNGSELPDPPSANESSTVTSSRFASSASTSGLEKDIGGIRRTPLVIPHRHPPVPTSTSTTKATN
ncbi:MAG: hypothetical protein R3C02_18760 [Planctomycetaceae bacterium]